MCRIYTIGIVHEKVLKNPIEKVETPSKSNYKAIMIAPAQTMAILGKLGTICCTSLSCWPALQQL